MQATSFRRGLDSENSLAQYGDKVGEEYKEGRYYVLNVQTGEMKAFRMEMEGVDEEDISFENTEENGKMILRVQGSDSFENVRYYDADAKQILRGVGF